MANDKMTKIAIKCFVLHSHHLVIGFSIFNMQQLKLPMPSILLTSVRTIFFTIADAISLHDFDNYHQLS